MPTTGEEAAVPGEDLLLPNGLQSIPDHDQRLDRFGKHQRFVRVLEADLAVANRRVVPIDDDALRKIVLALLLPPVAWWQWPRVGSVLHPPTREQAAYKKYAETPKAWQARPALR